MSVSAHLVDGARRFRDSDVYYSFKRSPITVIAAAVTAIFMISALFAPWLAPHQPFDLATVELLDGFTPPVWQAGGDPRVWWGAAGDAGHRNGFPTPSGGAPPRPEAASQGFRAPGRAASPAARDAPHRHATRSLPKALGSRLYESILRTFGISS